MFGDLFQLPAVTKAPIYQQLYERPMFERFRPFILETNVRQEGDTEFQDLLSHICKSDCPQEIIEKLQTRVCGKGLLITEECKKIHSKDSIVLCAKHVPRNKINQNIQESTLKDQPLFSLKDSDYDASGLFLDTDMSDKLNEVPQVMDQVIVVRLGAKLMVIMMCNKML